MSNANSGAPAFVVRAPSATYPVYVEWGALDRLGERIIEAGLRGPVFVVTDSTVAWLYAGRAEASLSAAGLESHFYTVPAGEASKSLANAGELYEWLASHHCERGSTIVALGGGMVGDLAGFAAATFLRGVAVVQAPTSLASMVDASIGGKTAVNLPAGKNLVGAFYQPRMVSADLATLRSQSARELASGWAEAIKHGLILDPSLYRLFEERVEDLLDLEPEITEEVVRRSMAIKGQIVQEDERETLGRRTLLNYGHTIGHGLEAATEYESLLHGEAVSVGMAAVGEIARSMGLLPGDEVERYVRVLRGFGLPVAAPGVDADAVLAAMKMDKKTAGRRINWVLLEGIGRAVVRPDVPDELAEATVRAVCSGEG